MNAVLNWPAHRFDFLFVASGGQIRGSVSAATVLGQVLAVQLFSRKFRVFRLSDPSIEAVNVDFAPIERGVPFLMQFCQSV
jgi:hypothetical protein